MSNQNNMDFLQRQWAKESSTKDPKRKQIERRVSLSMELKSVDDIIKDVEQLIFASYENYASENGKAATLQKITQDVAKAEKDHKLTDVRPVLRKAYKHIQNLNSIKP